MKILYFDCFSGISGDMTLGALLDIGIDKNLFMSELKKLKVEGWDIKFDKSIKNGITANNVDVIVEHSGHCHRNLLDINNIIDKSDISLNAKKIAKAIFLRLAKAEAKVHNSTPEQIHFHEVGAIDSIIDIAGTAICLDILSPDSVYSSVINDGHGFINCQHGTIPVPVPATMEILSTANANFKQISVEGELVTPTGAAIIAEIAKSYGNPPIFKPIRTGYGSGKKDYNIPNVLRVTLGEIDSTKNERIAIIETNIDDSNPEILAYTMDRLFKSGAKDVFFTPIYMKKNRPATMLTVMCAEQDISKMEDILFTETSTLGVRKYFTDRTCLEYKLDTIDTEFGKLDIKVCEYKGIKKVSPEYNSAKNLALENNVPLTTIYNKINI